MKRNKNNSLFDPVLLRRSLRASFTKLDPRQMIKNPIMFTVEAVTFAMLLLIVRIAVTGDTSQGSLLYNLVIFAVLLLTVLFANFAEAIAEARGRAQADSLRKTREETPAKRIEPDGQSHIVSSSELKQGDLFECVAGDTVAADGEIVEGLASIDESAITGESAPVIREAGGDKSSVTGGTKVLSDRILVKVTARPGESFLDRMIALVEGSSRQKTPNEIALTILLAGFTLVFVIVCATLKPFADYVGANITVAAFISLFVCLIPTTIGGLLSAIGIAGMDRALRANVITKSGKAVETAKKNGEAVKAPVEVEATRNSITAPVVNIEVPKSAGETKVEIPVTNVKPGTVAVLVHPDGTEEILKDSVPTEDGIQLTVDGGTTVKIVDNSKDFIDTREHWLRDQVNFVAARELFQGVGDNQFGAGRPMTRGMVNTVLARLAGVDTTPSQGQAWYEVGTDWAKKNGISDGTNPTAPVTREQLATLLYRYAGSPSVSGTLHAADAASVSDYAEDALLWANQNGIVNGVGSNTIAPKDNAQRAQVAAMLARYLQNQ